MGGLFGVEEWFRVGGLESCLGFRGDGLREPQPDSVRELRVQSSEFRVQGSEFWV